MYSVTRYHDIDCGHRVVGQGGKCERLHGHSYRIHFTCMPASWPAYNPAGGLDKVGRVIDFGVIKAKLCQWLEDNWDHRFLMWSEDPWIHNVCFHQEDGIVSVPFNPTAENMAQFLVGEIGPFVLNGTGVRLTKVVVEETRKCSAQFEVTK